jgi:hypothetical protein
MSRWQSLAVAGSREVALAVASSREVAQSRWQQSKRSFGSRWHQSRSLAEQTIVRQSLASEQVAGRANDRSESQAAEQTIVRSRWQSLAAEQSQYLLRFVLDDL